MGRVKRSHIASRKNGKVRKRNKRVHFEEIQLLDEESVKDVGIVDGFEDDPMQEMDATFIQEEPHHGNPTSFNVESDQPLSEDAASRSISWDNPDMSSLNSVCVPLIVKQTLELITHACKCKCVGEAIMMYIGYIDHAASTHFKFQCSGCYKLFYMTSVPENISCSCGSEGTVPVIDSPLFSPVKKATLLADVQSVRPFLNIYATEEVTREDIRTLDIKNEDKEIKSEESFNREIDIKEEPFGVQEEVLFPEEGVLNPEVKQREKRTNSDEFCDLNSVVEEEDQILDEVNADSPNAGRYDSSMIEPIRERVSELGNYVGKLDCYRNKPANDENHFKVAASASKLQTKENHPCDRDLLSEMDSLRRELKIQKYELEKVKNLKRKKRRKVFKHPNLSGQTVGESDTEYVDETEEEDDSRQIVVHQSSNDGLHRKWDKLQYCIFCSYGFTNISKHLFRNHKTEKEVQIILDVPAKSKARALLLEKLRNRGNYNHNLEILRNGKGCIVPWRRPASFCSYKMFVPCIYCLGFFKKCDLWKHDKACPHKTSKYVIPYRKLVSNSSMLLPVSKEKSNAVSELVFSHMHKDHLFMIIKNDHTILRFAEKLYAKVCDIDNPHLYISQKLREIARFLHQIKTFNTGISSLADTLSPDHFRSVVFAVEAVAGYDEVSGKYTTPSLALKLGHSLKKCAFIELSFCLEKNNEGGIKNCERFIKLMEVEWETEISLNALRKLDTNKWNKLTALSFAEDIIKLNKYLTEQMIQCQKSLIIQNDAATWSKLSKLALCSVILFNRKRSGEASKVKVEAYKAMKNICNLCDVYSSLSNFEKEICSKYLRVEIRGKNGRKVPVIFTPFIIEIIDLLLKTRNRCGINPLNEYLFPYSHDGALNSLRGHDVLNSAAKSCGAKYPENITSTKLRKHIATFMQILNLKDNELDQLATFMGHNIGVHREFYRLPENGYQLAKVGKLLIALDEGNFDQYKGKSLEEIEIDMNEEITENTKLDEEIQNDVHLELEESSCHTELNEKENDTLLNEITCGTSFYSIASANKSKKRKEQEINSPSERDEEEENIPKHICKKIEEKQKIVSNLDNCLVKRAKFTRHTWPSDEKKFINSYFANFYKLQKLPGKSDILHFQRTNLTFSRYSWLKLKDLCRREMNKLYCVV